MYKLSFWIDPFAITEKGANDLGPGVRVYVCVGRKELEILFFSKMQLQVGVLVPFAEKGACPSRVPKAGMKNEKKKLFKFKSIPQIL